MNFLRMIVAISVLSLCGGVHADDGEPAPKEWKNLRVGDYTLAYTCAGASRPTLILEAPSGIATEKAYEKIYPELAKRYRVCFAERLGFGKSDKVPEGLVQTTRDYADEVLHLVDAVAPEEKVVLVGYSFGGFITRYFAAVHPDRAAGLLLIDSAQEDWIVDVKKRMSPEDWSRMQGILDWFLRTLGHNYWDSQFEVASVSLPRDLPVRIISRGLPYQHIRKAALSEEGVAIYNEMHDRHQLDLLGLTDRTSRVVATKSEHLIVDSEPELVLAEIESLVSQVTGAK